MGDELLKQLAQMFRTLGPPRADTPAAWAATSSDDPGSSAPAQARAARGTADVPHERIIAFRYGEHDGPALSASAPAASVLVQVDVRPRATLLRRRHQVRRRHLLLAAREAGCNRVHGDLERRLTAPSAEPPAFAGNGSGHLPHHQALDGR